MKTAMKYQWMTMIRSKWLISFGVLFTILAAILVGSSGNESFSGFTRSTAALLNLSLLLIPLVTLLTGSLFLSGEKEDGRLALLLTYPISTRALIGGLYIGSFLSLLTVISFGYGGASIALFLIGGGWSSFFFLSFFLTVLLAGIFLAISMFIGLYTSNRLQAIGVSLLIWAFFVLFYEFFIVGILSMIPKGWVLPLFVLSIIMNPVELVRVWTITAMKSGTIFGPQLYEWTKWAESMNGQFVFFGVACIWMVIPLIFANFLIKRGNRDA
ncbi:ABC transporter permease [Thermolongibacillus altinsuensis]